MISGTPAILQLCSLPSGPRGAEEKNACNLGGSAGDQGSLQAFLTAWLWTGGTWLQVLSLPLPHWVILSSLTSLELSFHICKMGPNTERPERH